MEKLHDLIDGFKDGLRQATRGGAGPRWVPAIGVLLGGSVAIYSLVRLASD